MIFSHSALSLYRTCPRAFKYSYIDKVKVNRSPALKKGSNIHKILEKYPENVELNNFNESSIVNEFFNSDLGNSIKNVLLNKKTKREFKFGLTKTFENANFYNSFFHGIIDLIYVDNGTLNLCDYKTGKYHENQDFSQLLSYAIFFKKFEGNIKIRYIYVEHNKENALDVSKSDIQNAETQIIKTSDIIMQDKTFERKCSSACNWCLYKDKCDEFLEEIRVKI